MIVGVTGRIRRSPNPPRHTLHTFARDVATLSCGQGEAAVIAGHT